jgi:hypothetical protein
MQGGKKLRGEAHNQVRRSGEVAAQDSRWTFTKPSQFDLQLPLPGSRGPNQFRTPLPLLVPNNLNKTDDLKPSAAKQPFHDEKRIHYAAGKENKG